MVTMQKVANYAGVSLATVSRVVNGRGVSPKLSQLVTVALDELRYRPNAFARALTTKKNAVIGVIISQSLNQNPLITAFISSFQFFQIR
ncbi:Catabolite control protein A [Vibrio ruber DSM 16370]|uniref:Catabolite control protein A n=2 Tax=Vibrio ruber TaxID=184755 RepID=A0A1R4LNR8_VIBR1|nr:Catabolite control protein A [Vibrio ruber DSM 16370]